MKKLLNKKGSVLFLVVVVMSILLVVASATYYIVSNQRQSVEVHYNSEQSYQTAYSVSRTVSDYLLNQQQKINSSNSFSYENTIFGKIAALSEGGTITSTTDKEAFRNLGLGDFEVTIKKTKGAANAEEMEFEVTTKSTVNDETTSLTQVWKVKLSAKETKYFTRFLTSTGLGVPTDTYLKVQNIFGDNYFENEFTTIEHPTEQNKSIYSSGTIIDYGINYNNFTDKEVVVGGNYYIDGSNSREINVKRILVGKDMYVKRNESILANSVYVVGDLIIDTGEFKGNNTTFFVQGDCYVKQGKIVGNCTIYANNIYWSSTIDGGSQLKYCGELYDGSGNNKITVNGITKTTKTEVEGEINSRDEKFAEEGKENSPTGWAAVAAYISNNTAVGTYKEWDALSFFEEGGKFENAPVININNEINTVANNNAAKGYITTIDPNKPDDKKSTMERPNAGSQNAWLLTIKETCKLPVSESSATTSLAIVIDASDEDIYVYLDDDGTHNYTFYPTGRAVNVLIKGSHPVIFVLPEDVTFDFSNQQFIGHYALAKKLSGAGNFDTVEYLTQGPNLTDKITGKGDYDSKIGNVAFKTEKGDDNEEYTFLNKDAFGGETIHNNIFLVSRENNSFSFNASNVFAGYVYAPRSTLEVTTGGGACMRFFGGLIVGGFRYDHQSGLLGFCQPYDPYNKDKSGNVIGANVVANLIAEAGGEEISDGDSPNGLKNVILTPEGYK